MEDLSNKLIVAATSLEVQPLLDRYKFYEMGPDIWTSDDIDCSIMITGVGMVSTIFALAQRMNERPELMINAGVCGSFNRSLGLGDVVSVTKDCFSEMGAESPTGFVPIVDMGLPLESLGGTNGWITSVNPVPKVALKEVKGITVNTVHGRESSIKEIVERLDPDVETMEGAAAMYASRMNNVPCLQIRAISNYVEPRNKENWELDLAITRLNDFLIDLLEDTSG